MLLPPAVLPRAFVSPNQRLHESPGVHEKEQVGELLVSSMSNSRYFPHGIQT